MGFADIGLFQLADRKLAWVDERQVLLAQNIANADTPGFVAKDLQPFAKTLAAQTAASPVRTNPLHLAGTQGAPLQPDVQALPSERAPDGNAVAIEKELTKVAQTDDAHALVTNLYKTYLTMFHTAIT